MKKYYLSFIAIALFTVPIDRVAAQTSYTGESETPPTIQMKVENIKARQDTAITELVTLFQRVSTQPELISSKEVVDSIDQGDRALKNTKAACDAVLTALRNEANTIKNEASFSDDQKTELLGAVELLIAKSDELSARSVATVKQLSGSYKEMAKWRKVYKTYLNLDGQIKAQERLKASVDEFTKKLTAPPEPVEQPPADTSDEKKTE